MAMTGEGHATGRRSHGAARGSVRIFGRASPRPWRWGSPRSPPRGSAVSFSSRSGGSPPSSCSGNGSDWCAASRLVVERVAVGALALALAALFALHNSVPGGVATLVLGAGAVGWLAGPAGRESGPAAGVLYAGALVVSLGLLRASPSYGLAAILWLFAVVWGADVAAYFAGRLIGGPRLWPSVSPGKTWSGAIVGALAGAACGLMLGGVDEPHRRAVLARARGGDRVRSSAICSNPRSSAVSASRIRAASFPAMAE